MDGGVHQDLSVICAVPLLSQRDLVPAVAAGLRGEVLRSAEIYPSAGQVGGDARLHDLPGDSPRLHIHVCHAGDARCDHLRQTQAGPGGHRPLVQLGLGGEDEIVQPVLQVLAPAVPPHKGHGQVGVGVHKAGHQHLSGAVDHPVKRPLGVLCAHRGDLCPLHRHIGVL